MIKMRGAEAVTEIKMRGAEAVPRIKMGEQRRFQGSK